MLEGSSPNALFGASLAWFDGVLLVGAPGQSKWSSVNIVNRNKTFVQTNRMGRCLSSQTSVTAGLFNRSW